MVTITHEKISLSVKVEFAAGDRVGSTVVVFEDDKVMTHSNVAPEKSLWPQIVRWSTLSRGVRSSALHDSSLPPFVERHYSRRPSQHMT